MEFTVNYSENYLEHHGILGQKWGVRRFQNPDGTLTAEGKKRYGDSDEAFEEMAKNYTKKTGAETNLSYYDYQRKMHSGMFDSKRTQAFNDFVSKGMNPYYQVNAEFQNSVQKFVDKYGDTSLDGISVSVNVEKDTGEVFLRQELETNGKKLLSEYYLGIVDSYNVGKEEHELSSEEIKRLDTRIRVNGK